MYEEESEFLLFIIRCPSHKYKSITVLKNICELSYSIWGSENSEYIFKL